MRALLAGLLLVLAAGMAAAGGSQPRAFVRGSWADIRSAHQGRAVIVHLWGLSCTPCLTELPDWGAFVKANPAVDFVLIDADQAAGRRSPGKDRIAEAGLGEVEQWAFGDSHADRLRFEIDPSWMGELPYTLLIGRDGAITTFAGSADFAGISRWVSAQMAR